MAAVARQTRPGQVRRRAAKGHNDRRAEGGGDVHGPGVVGENDAAELEQRHELPQRGLPGQVEDANAGEPGNLVAEFPITVAPKRQPEAIPHPSGHFSCDGGKARCRPAFGGAVFRAGIQAKQNQGLVGSGALRIVAGVG